MSEEKRSSRVKGAKAKKAEAKQAVLTRPPPPAEDWTLDSEFSDEPIAKRADRTVEDEISAAGLEGRGWKIAASMVNRFRPVPSFVWPIVHTVYGRSNITEVDPMAFSNVSQLIVRGALDKTLGQLPARSDAPARNLTESVRVTGADVAAALCLIHAVCRRISTVVSERVSRPILDDALLRTHIGFYVGRFANGVGAGRGMLAGFAGRCGLAVQIAAGDIDQAQRALAGMASGQDMSQVCVTVYGCDPLEVAALTLISGGCAREIAFGISSYSTKRKDVVPGTEQYRWLSMFSIVEHTRMGVPDQIKETYWNELGYDPARRQELADQVSTAQRRGHGWSWMTQPQLISQEQAAEPIKNPSEIRGLRKKNDLAGD